jgi:hypothetical protein
LSAKFLEDFYVLGDSKLLDFLFKVVIGGRHTGCALAILCGEY